MAARNPVNRSASFRSSSRNIAINLSIVVSAFGTGSVVFLVVTQFGYNGCNLLVNKGCYGLRHLFALLLLIACGFGKNAERGLIGVWLWCPCCLALLFRFLFLRYGTQDATVLSIIGEYLVRYLIVL
jgi:hypothetical protein